MNSVYLLTKKQIENDKKNKTHVVTPEKLETLLLAGRLTPEEYGKLLDMLK